MEIKKFKLKRKVRNVLMTIVLIALFVLCVFVLDAHYRNAVEDCVAGGNTRVFCENTLR